MRAPARVTTRYGIGSTSTLFTTMAVLQLVDAGEVGLPGSSHAKAKPTRRHHVVDGSSSSGSSPLRAHDPVQSFVNWGHSVAMAA